MKKNSSSIIKKIVDFAVVFVILAVVFGGLVKAVFLPSDINTYENRKSYKLAFPTVETFLDGSFQSNTENALSDQVAYAKRMKQAYNDIISKYLDAAVTPFSKTVTDSYIRLGNHFLYDEDNLLYAMYDKESSNAAVKTKSDKLNTLFEKYPELEFFAYYIEKDTDIDFSTGDTLGVSDTLVNNLLLPSANKAVYEINDFTTFDKYFYKTDHHWNADGSYEAYLQLMSLLGIDEEPVAKGEKQLIADKFSGSKTQSQETARFNEPFYAYHIDYPQMSISCNGTPCFDYGAQQAFFDGVATEPISYGAFYGGDMGETIFDSGRTDKENILIIGESYDNALLKLVASHYNRTYSIDLRNYETFMGKKFDFASYVADNSIDKVLFIGNVDFYISDVFDVEG